MTLNGSFLRNLWVIIYTIVRFATTAPPSEAHPAEALAAASARAGAVRHVPPC